MELGPKLKGFWNESFWTLGLYWENSEIQLSLNWAEVQACFSPNYYTELKNLPKEKLEDFKSSKTVRKGPRADSCWILKYKAVNLGGSFGHLEISGVQGFNKFSLDYFMFPFAKDLD